MYSVLIHISFDLLHVKKHTRHDLLTTKYVLSVSKFTSDTVCVQLGVQPESNLLSAPLAALSAALMLQDSLQLQVVMRKTVGMHDREHLVVIFCRTAKDSYREPFCWKSLTEVMRLWLRRLWINCCSVC